ncbi:MAG: glycoside hydrolase family 5 protein [Balneolaceae bacterium]|nr:glycoside hydrolase family 5 protein [Balneolaceae bacterium]
MNRTARVPLSSILFMVFALLCSPACTVSQNTGSTDSDPDPVQPQPAQPVDPFEQNASMQRGINLGNALEAPSEGEWGMTIREEFIQLIKDAGFDAVRIPVRWNAHAMTSSPYTIDPDFFERVDDVIEWVLERDLMIVLNIHHYNALMKDPGAHRQRFFSLWRQIAEHYHDAPNSLLFETLNEPHGELTADLWNEYLREAIGVIRESNPYRTLVIGTAPWGGFGGITDLSLPDDDRNIITTVHYYNPFHFTHQGASWVGEEADKWLGTTWTGTPEQKEQVNSDFDKVLSWAEEHNRPVHLGEFGAYSAAPMKSRELWTEYIRKSAEKRDFSWSYWEFGAGFGIYDRDQRHWRTGLLKALIPESPELESR